MSKRGETWGFDETNLILDLWADGKIQRLLEDCPTRNINVFKTVAEKAKEMKPEFDRTAAECRSKMKRLKAKYFQLKRQSRKSGAGGISWTYWAKLDDVLGCRPISNPVSSINSMSSNDNWGKLIFNI